MVPNYSSREEYEKQFALGVSMYGQMTAGSFCYIGPQGIVHGTTVYGVCLSTCQFTCCELIPFSGSFSLYGIYVTVYVSS